MCGKTRNTSRYFQIICVLCLFSSFFELPIGKKENKRNEKLMFVYFFSVFFFSFFWVIPFTSTRIWSSRRCTVLISVINLLYVWLVLCLYFDLYLYEKYTLVKRTNVVFCVSIFIRKMRRRNK